MFIRIGDPVQFHPTAFVNCMAGAMGYPASVSGKIVGWNRAHRWFRVAYSIGGTTQHECFAMPVPPDPDPPNMAAGHRGDWNLGDD